MGATPPERLDCAKTRVPRHQRDEQVLPRRTRLGCERRLLLHQTAARQRFVMADAHAGSGEFFVRSQVLRYGFSPQALCRSATIHEPVCEPISFAEAETRAGHPRL